MKSLLLLSGGIDSTVLLAARTAANDDVTAITFDYGQTHACREIPAAKAVARHYGLNTRIITIDDIFAGSALLGDGPIPDGHAVSPDATTVPGRNLVMLSIGAALAAAQKAAAVFIGANHDDANGYLDCRPRFIDAAAEAVSLGTKVSISAPFLSKTKAEIIAMGRQLRAPLDLTWSCYRNSETQCGRCGACEANAAAADTPDVCPYPDGSWAAAAWHGALG